MRLRSEQFEVSENQITFVSPPCRDPNDNQFLALALQCQATVLVSSDADLLVLNPWNEIPILSPADFLLRFE